ncbi:MAG: DUF1080 domain-containing protein [Fimbriimonadaceae bacterium]
MDGAFESILGRWDLTVGDDDRVHPAWLEILDTREGLAGRFVGEVGSARPIPSISIAGTRLRFQLPKQYEARDTDLVFEGEYKADRIAGRTTDNEGNEIPWSAVRAPALDRTGEPKWGEPINLIPAEGLRGWEPRSPEGECCWANEGGQLVNKKVGSDLVTTACFDDFKLVAEYSYPPKSNSGIYLRGRYEVQILDDFGAEPSVTSSGAVYGFIAPSKNAVKKAGERNVAEITLLGRKITVVLNGETVIDNVEVPGITGGALDSDEGQPGPLMIQGDHGPVTFHRLELTPATF